MTAKPYSIAVFPFLKTSGQVSIGGINFRPTDNIDALQEYEAHSVREIAEMLYLRDHLRIKSASYAILPELTLSGILPDLTHLAHVQAVVAYLYSSPHEVLGHAFLTSEHASMAVFSPCNIPAALVRPDFNVISTGDFPELSPDSVGQVSGYFGIYNFRNYFYVVPGSRLYGPAPHLTLNHAQDLFRDLGTAVSNRSEYRLLLMLLNSDKTIFSSRVFTSILWHRTANSEAVDEGHAIVNLAIAFETLLGLPAGSKTDRIVDAISLLLGRLPRLEEWARQFYDARSGIAHEGFIRKTDFEVTKKDKPGVGQTYRSLLSYGNQIFRLCLGTLLTGNDLAKKERIEEKFVTNQERFESICQILSAQESLPQEQLNRITQIIETINQYRFVNESGLKIETMIGACRLAAKSLLAYEKTLAEDAVDALNGLVEATKTKNHLEELNAVHELSKLFRDKTLPSRSDYAAIFAKVIDIVWGYVFMHHHWLKEEASKGVEKGNGGERPSTL